jgi:hypothetical protein
MNQIIVSAIEKSQLLLLQYNGFSRTVEPHAYGIDKKGVEKLRCFQVAGGSVSHDPVAWKILTVAEIDAIILSEACFAGARPGYKRGDTAMQRIYAEL